MHNINYKEISALENSIAVLLQYNVGHVINSSTHTTSKQLAPYKY